ncbi:hypothetical protein D3C73_1303030 [compost metagenome]
MRTNVPNTSNATALIAIGAPVLVSVDVHGEVGGWRQAYRKDGFSGEKAGWSSDCGREWVPDVQLEIEMSVQPEKFGRRIEV